MKDKSLFALALVLLATTATAAETCYQDDTGRIVKRRRPGYTEVPCPDENAQPGATPSAPPTTAPTEDTGRAARRQVIQRAPPAYVSPIPRPGLADYVASVPVPDRWRIVDTLGYKERWYDPYNRNSLKADRPVHGDDWFFNLGVISDTVYELREVPTICVDSSEFVVSKLKDRGSHQAFGVVTNAQDFMHILRLYVEKELEMRGTGPSAR